MAIISSFSHFADADTLTTTVGNNVEGTTFDLGAAAPGDISVGGKPIYAVVTVTAAVTGNAGATCRFQLCTASNSGLTSDVVAHVSTDFFSVDGTTELPVGTTALAVQLPAEGVAYARYMGIRCVVGSATLTAGAISAYLTQCPPKHAAFADGAPTPA